MGKLVFLRGTIGAGKTTIAKMLQKERNDLFIIEIDEIKQKHGTIENCNPCVVFPEAGKKANEAFIAGKIVIIVEPLVTKDHFQFVLDQIAFKKSFISIWLECDLATAISRKKHLSENIIKEQFKRYKNRFQPSGELSIDTYRLSQDEVKNTILSVI
jgi:predicted kinase